MTHRNNMAVYDPRKESSTVKLRILVLSLVAICLLASCARQPKPALTGDVVASAKAFVDLLAKGDFTGATQSFDATMKTAMPPEKLEQTWTQLSNAAGSYKQQLSTRKEQSGEFTVVYVTCEFEKTNLDIKVVYNSTKQISGLWLLPSAARTE